MELREFAESVLFAETLQAKLAPPPLLTDDCPGPSVLTPSAPGRPPELRFKPGHGGKGGLPRLNQLEATGETSRLLHCFANHELLATELMALVLLRFPEAPKAFRRAVLQTLKEEQEHTRWYVDRLRQFGVGFGEQPVSGYFWRAISSMETPLDYVAGLSLTFEQANLDFARSYSKAFARIGDQDSATLLHRIYHDEIAHVACGLKWFRKWKDPEEDDWQAFRRRLRFPLSPQRAKGPEFNEEGRLAAGLDRRFIDELRVFAQSKGRTPAVFFFNPFAEGYISSGPGFAPNEYQQKLQSDLENLPQFLCRRDDVVVVRQRPSLGRLQQLQSAGFPTPEFAETGPDGGLEAATLQERKLSDLRPWAWGPDSLKLFAPVLLNVTTPRHNAEQYFGDPISKLYSKQWSAELLKDVLSEVQTNRPRVGEQACGNSPFNWLCAETEVGRTACDVSQALSHIQTIREEGRHDIVLKQAVGLAGHNAIRLLEPRLLPSQLRWIEKSLTQGRRLVIEPWLDRLADFSLQLEMTNSGLRHLGFTGLLNDWKGQYKGNWACPGFEKRPCLPLQRMFPQVPDIAHQLTVLYDRIVRLLEKKLQQSGYLGPLGIDALVFRGLDGAPHVKPIVEINPRYTMGRVNLELMHYIAPGSSGLFRLVSLRQIKAEGFDSFYNFAVARSQQQPLVHKGDPISKIRSGFVCLTDPERAQVCVATLEVFPAGKLPAFLNEPASPDRPRPGEM